MSESRPKNQPSASSPNLPSQSLHKDGQRVPGVRSAGSGPSLQYAEAIPSGVGDGQIPVDHQGPPGDENGIEVAPTTVDTLYGNGNVSVEDGGCSQCSRYVKCNQCVPPGCRGNVPRPVVPPKLNFFHRVMAGSGHVLNDLCASLWFTYLLLYFEEVAKFDSKTAAILLLIGQVVDGFSTPLIGYETDRVNHCWLCKKGYGRCKSWHLIGVTLVMISFPFIFSPCINCEGSDIWAKAIYYAPFIMIFQIGWASTQISHLALIPKMSPDVLVRTELLAIRYAFTIAANVAIFLMTWVSLGTDSRCTINESDAPAFRNIALMAVGIGGIFTLFFHLFVVELTDEQIKTSVSAMANGGTKNERRRPSLDKKSELVESITCVESITSSVAISKNLAKRRRTPTPTTRRDKEAGQALLSDQDPEDFDDTDRDPLANNPNLNAVSVVPSGMSQVNDNIAGVSRSTVLDGKYSTKSLNIGQVHMTLRDWLTLPQFYIVALMYMATRLSVNLTQIYIPLYVQETLHGRCGAVATIPLTMFCSGFFVTLFIKMINKYCGRQLAYTFGAILSVTGSVLILCLDWNSKNNLDIGIYGVAVLLGGGASAILVTSLSITADMIGNNVENGAFVYGAMSFCDKLSCGLFVMLINSVKPIVKGEGEYFYKYVVAYSCGGCALVGTLAVLGLSFIIYKQNSRREPDVLHTNTTQLLQET